MQRVRNSTLSRSKAGAGFAALGSLVGTWFFDINTTSEYGGYYDTSLSHMKLRVGSNSDLPACGCVVLLGWGNFEKGLFFLPQVLPVVLPKHGVDMERMNRHYFLTMETTRVQCLLLNSCLFLSFGIYAICRLVSTCGRRHIDLVRSLHVMNPRLCRKKRARWSLALNYRQR